MAGGPVKVYLDFLSQPCRALYIFLKHNKIPHTVQLVALRKGEHKSPDFTRLNPMQRVPVMEHDKFVLTESDAILKYLANTYDVAEHWYPRDPKRRARVDEYTAWHHANTRLNVVKVFMTEVLLPMMTGQPAEQKKLEQALQELDQTLRKMEEMFLKRQAFLCGDDITIADLLAVCEVMQPLGAGRDVLKNHEQLQNWKSRVQSALGEPFNEAHSFLFKLGAKKPKL
ncbi:glutathione S-transferase theta-2 [Astyanax mexicanus]|uniref:glutathione S-transferase theta-2 n=1 Tax=Astyanax mexicanus TaxID=7994 RepID=UPI0020CB289B|nr:glutathione S-transferase theta-2 [Astyanax mexicanus]